MNWTYRNYAAMNMGMSFSLFVVTWFIVFFISWCTEVRLFIIRQIIGVELQEFRPLIQKDSNRTDERVQLFNVTLPKTSVRLRVSTVIFIIYSSLIIAFMPVLLFNGCVLDSRAFIQHGICPEHSMDCFLFAKNTDLSPIASFHCHPESRVNFSTTYPHSVIWCYSWILRDQTTKKVLDQIGICAGVTSVFATQFALIVYLSKYRRLFWLLLMILIASCVMIFVSFALFKIALSSLTYVTFILWASNLIFGMFFSFLVGQLKSPFVCCCDGKEQIRIESFPMNDVHKNFPQEC